MSIFLHSERLCKLYKLHTVVRIMKCRRQCWAGRVS